MKRSFRPILFGVLFILIMTVYSVKQKVQTDVSEPAAAQIENSSVSESNTGTIGKGENVQESNYKRDLDNDGMEEEIKVIFKREDTDPGSIPERYSSYKITITSGGNQYDYEEKYVSNGIAGVSFADFDIKDNYIEFYINSDGPSGDPSSAVYRFDKSGIRKMFDTAGFITEYDREGKIYTEFSKTTDKYAVVLSYYDIREDSIVYVDKSKLIGKKLQYDNSLIIFSGIRDDSGMRVSYVDDNQGQEEVRKAAARYNKDIVVKICRPNEEPTIVDIDSTYHGLFKEGNPRNIRIMVKTEDGSEGWLEWLNGGD